MTTTFAGAALLIGAAPMFNLSDVFWILFLLGSVGWFMAAAMGENRGSKKAAPRTVPAAPMMDDPSVSPQSASDGLGDGFGQESIDFDFK